MPVLVANIFRILYQINLIARSILRGLALRSKENVVVVLARAERASRWIIIPFLHEQNAGLRSGVRLESVGMQANNGEYAAALGNEITNTLVGRIIESALRQDDRHPPARPEEIEIAFDEKHVTAHRFFET